MIVFLKKHWFEMAVMIFAALALASLPGCAKQELLAVKPEGIRPPAALMVPPEELPKRDPANTAMSRVAGAWAEDRRIGGQCVATLKDLQAFNRSIASKTKENGK